jgi:hypothetical protein
MRTTGSVVLPDSTTHRSTQRGVGTVIFRQIQRGIHQYRISPCGEEKEVGHNESLSKKTRHRIQAVVPGEGGGIGQWKNETISLGLTDTLTSDRQAQQRTDSKRTAA